MGNTFCSSSGAAGSSSSKQAGITDVDQTMLALKSQRKKLVDQQRLLEARMDRSSEQARALLREDKRERAMFELKKRKLVERRHTELGGLIMNVETLINNVESQCQTNAVVAVLKQGNDAMRVLQQAVSLDDVQRVLEDSAQARLQYEEMARLLGGQLSDVDSAAVEEELRALEELAAMQEHHAMPKVPATQPPAAAAVAAAAQQQAQAQAQAEARQREPMLAA